MAKTTSKKTSASSKPSKPAKQKRAPEAIKSSKTAQLEEPANSKTSRQPTSAFKRLRAKWCAWRKERVNPHKSFRRSYREDYVRETKAPGLIEHAMTTFQLIFQHWKIFLPLILLMTSAYIILVGLMSEDLYLQFQDSIDETSAELLTDEESNLQSQDNAEVAGGKLGNFAKAGLLLLSTITTGGLDLSMGESQTIFMLFLFLVMWMTTIYLIRHLLAGGKPKLRDGLYNALSPLISTLLIFCVIFVQAIPVILVVITYSAAIATGFLSTPFYALVYFIFAALMILITLYLFSSSLLALVAVTAPGVYPLKALSNASDLINGRRTKFILRFIYLLFVVVFIYIIILTPIILIDLWLKSSLEFLAGWPIVPFFLLLVTCFSFVYATIYLYRYYRWLLDYQEK